MACRKTSHLHPKGGGWGVGGRARRCWPRPALRYAACEREPLECVVRRGEVYQEVSVYCLFISILVYVGVQSGCVCVFPFFQAKAVSLGFRVCVRSKQVVCEKKEKDHAQQQRAFPPVDWKTCERTTPRTTRTQAPSPARARACLRLLSSCLVLCCCCWWWWWWCVWVCA